MKGTIVNCLEELVTAKFGAEKWKESLEKAGISEWHTFSALGAVQDTEFMEIMKGVAGAVSLPEKEVMDRFGEYWSTVYAPRVYGAFFSKAKSVCDLILNLDHIHQVMTRSMKQVQPPHFRYEWKGEKLLIMHYESRRGLVALMPGLIRGLGKHFKVKLAVRVVGSAVHVQFP